MTEENRLALEGYYIKGTKYGYSDEIKTLIDHERWRINHNKKNKRNRRKLNGRDNNYLFLSFTSLNIFGEYKFTMGLKQDALNNLRHEAKYIFKEYMELKQEIRESGSYADPVIRDVFNNKKQEWNDISNKIIKAKYEYFAAALYYNKIKEYFDATSDRIKYLENELKNVSKT